MLYIHSCIYLLASTVHIENTDLGLLDKKVCCCSLSIMAIFKKGKKLQLQGGVTDTNST